MACRVQRQRRTLLGKLVMFQREPHKKRATHAKFSRTHTLAKTGNLWFCWMCGFHTAKRVQRACGTVSRNGANRCGVLRKLKDGRNLKDGGTFGANLACGGRADAVQATTKIGWVWCDVAHELERNGLDVNMRNFCWTSSDADAVSFIRTSSLKKLSQSN